MSGTDRDRDAETGGSLSSRATIPPTSSPKATPSAGAADAGSLPKKIGQYEIIRLLGQGAMGVVYLANDPRRKREVALKVPSIDLENDSEQQQRFYREARLAATLSHPNICSVYEVGQVDGQHYIAMQYIDGRPLSDFVQPDSPLPVDQVAMIVSKLAAAMEQAHRKGIVHRDVKPDNILIDRDREPVVMDFGLALDVDTFSDVRLTQTGTIMGSPAYMSPEQVEDDIKKIGPATDIYSLGVVLYELLTGRLPFAGSFASVLAQILKDEPPLPSKLRPEIHPTLDSICMRMIAKPIAGRFESMAKVSAALMGFLDKIDAESTAEEKSNRAKKGLSAFDRKRAMRDARVQRLEEHKRHIESLRKDGSYKTAVAMLEQMAGLRDPRYANYATWARELIPVLRKEPEQIRKQRAETLDTAQQLIDRHAYLEAKELLQQIPPNLRNEAVAKALRKAIKLNAECELLIDQIGAGVKRHETRNLLPKLERLLELRPKFKDAHHWYFRLTGKKFGGSSKRVKAPKHFWPLAGTVAIAVALLVWFVQKNWNSDGTGRNSGKQLAGLNADGKTQPDKTGPAGIPNPPRKIPIVAKTADNPAAKTVPEKLIVPIKKKIVPTITVVPANQQVVNLLK
ncbi:MAG: serine/threonine protein kinase, partial [Planctomycetes bacterium]|nr:serine/threonine protein kinase [Planctomycetota bacterium]